MFIKIRVEDDEISPAALKYYTDWITDLNVEIERLHDLIRELNKERDELQRANYLDITEGRTIWNSDGTDGAALICAPERKKP